VGHGFFTTFFFLEIRKCAFFILIGYILRKSLGMRKQWVTDMTRIKGQLPHCFFPVQQVRLDEVHLRERVYKGKERLQESVVQAHPPHTQEDQEDRLGPEGKACQGQQKIRDIFAAEQGAWRFSLLVSCLAHISLVLGA
jgi:hypothetical protein